MAVTVYFAAYGDGTYGSAAYQSSATTPAPNPNPGNPQPDGTPAANPAATATTAQPGASAANTGGVLQNTGLDIIVPIVVSISLIVAALILLVRRKPRSTQK